MQFLVTFLEGIISFISPCMLPLLPVYVTFFAGETGEAEGRRKNVWVRSLAFVLGFTLIFSLMGLFAGSIGGWLTSYRRVVNIVCGGLVIVFGLSYLGLIPLTFLKGIQKQTKIDGALSAFLFGMIYSVSLTPCVGAFLGSAIMMASSSGSAGKGVLLLLVYSLGLGIPFVLSAVLIDRLKGLFAAIKQHYGIINKVCGVFLMAVGICMMLGWMNRLMS